MGTPGINRFGHARNLVRRATGHTCHWPGCQEIVEPKLWGCRRHWFSLPKHLRDRIWRTYRPGQEIAKNPSPEYIEAARAVQDWIAEQQPKEP